MENPLFSSIKRIISPSILLLILIAPIFTYAQKQNRIQDLFNMHIEDLMNIKISTASKKPEKVSEIPASVVVITRKDIEINGYTSLNDILSNIPGFYMIDDYYWLGSVNFGIRGFFSTGTFNDVFIMVNGVNQIGDSYNDYPDVKINIPVESIDRIEIVRGPMSVIYGSGAFMGAINIITNDADNINNNSMLSLSAGSMNTKKAYIGLREKKEQFSYSFNGSISDCSGIDKPLKSMTSYKGFLEDVGLSLNSRTKNMLNDRRKYFNFSGKFGNLSFEFSHIESLKGIFDGMPSVGDGSKIFVQATNTSLKYDKSISDKLKFTGKIGYFFHYFSFIYQELFEDSYATNYTNSNALESEMILHYRESADFNLLLGMFQRTITNFYKTYDYPIFGAPYSNTEISFNDKTASDMAVFSQADINLCNKVKLVSGLRLEKPNKYGISISNANCTSDYFKKSGTVENDKLRIIPRIAVIYSLNHKNVFKLMYGEAIKNPSLVQNIAQLSAGLSGLAPAQIKTIEANYIFTISKFLMCNVSLFRNILQDLIIKRNVFDTSDNSWALYSTNSGKMSTNGIEVSLDVKPFKNFRCKLSGLYQHSENLEHGFSGHALGYSPKLLGYFNASYLISNNLSLSLNDRYIGSMKTEWDDSPIDPDNGNFMPIGRIGDEIGSYYVLDFNLRHNNFLRKRFFLNLHVFNILNREIRYPATSSNAWADKGTLGFDRTVLLTLGTKLSSSKR